MFKDAYCIIENGVIKIHYICILIKFYNMKKIEIDAMCQPYMYNTYNDLNPIKIGNVLTIKFGEKSYKVKKEYVGKKLKFVVNNFFEHNWRRKTKRLALVPIDKINSFAEEDVLILDDADRYECLMIDLFPVNRIPFSGWKNKTVKIVSVI